MSPEASSNAKRFLVDMGVNIILQKRVVDYKDGNVFLDDGQTIPTRTFTLGKWCESGAFRSYRRRTLDPGGTDYRQ